MEIKIDTSKDSKEEIKKVIAFLQNVVDSTTSETSGISFIDLPSKKEEVSAFPTMPNIFSNENYDNNANDKNYKNTESENLDYKNSDPEIMEEFDGVEDIRVAFEKKDSKDKENKDGGKSAKKFHKLEIVDI